MIDNIIIILEKWNMGLRFKTDLLSIMPLWIKLTNLELELRDRKAFSATASVLDKPIKVDRITVDESRVAFAKKLVEMEASTDFPSEVEAELRTGEDLKVQVEYMYKPLHCSTCKVFGHSTNQCKSRMEEVWVQKNMLK